MWYIYIYIHKYIYVIYISIYQKFWYYLFFWTDANLIKRFRYIQKEISNFKTLYLRFKISSRVNYAGATGLKPDWSETIRFFVIKIFLSGNCTSFIENVLHHKLQSLRNANALVRKKVWVIVSFLIDNHFYDFRESFCF